MQNKLLPCPFCGGKAHVGASSIWCENEDCGAEIGPILDDEELIKAWNTRKLMERIMEQLEEIYARNDKRKKEAYEEQDWEKFNFCSNVNNGIYKAIAIVKGGLNNETN